MFDFKFLADSEIVRSSKNIDSMGEGALTNKLSFLVEIKIFFFLNIMYNKYVQLILCYSLYIILYFRITRSL